MKHFKEMARSLGLMKIDHQPNVSEPETPASAPASEIILPSDAAAQRAGFSPELCEKIRLIRHEVLATLKQVPGFISAAQRMAEGSLYRVLVSEEHAHLFRESADGIVKPSLRDAHGQFVENIDLIRVPADIAGAIAAIAVQAALAEISAKFDMVFTAVDNLNELVRAANRGGLQGAIDALEVARRLRDDGERRRQVLDVCQQVLGELGTVIEQIRTEVTQMPSEDSDFWVGWNADRIVEADKPYIHVRDDFAVVVEGLQRVVASYLELGEFASGATAFTRVSSRLDASIRQAAERARLLPYPREGNGPERVFEDFLISQPTAEARLDALAAGVRPVLTLEIDRAESVA
jgi:hypothetical protein